jgi:SOS-response transcriptional repressor LexA
VHRFARNSIAFNSVSSKISVPLYEFAVAGEPLDDLPIHKVGRVEVNEFQFRSHYLCFRVQGHSMDDGTEFSIPDGSIIVIDRQEVEEARVGVLYLWQLPGTSPCIKELGLINGVPHLISYSPDPKFSPFELPEGAKPVSRVVGVLDEYGNIQLR